MAHLFKASTGMTKAAAAVAAKSATGSTIQVPPSGVVTFGVWGGDASGNWLNIRIYRGNRILTDGAVPAVPVRVLHEYGDEWVRILQADGLEAGDEIYGMTTTGQRYTAALTVTAPPASPSVVTREQLRDKAGVVQPKYPPSPAILALIALLNRGTDGTLRAAAGSLESAGRSGNLYEHTAGLALDIYRLSTDAAQRLQAHNLIRFFIDNRRAFGWRNMFYESWGFSQSGLMGGAPNHGNHIHIDWMDFSTLKFEGSNRNDRSTWTEVTWPAEALVGTSINTEVNANQVRAAWGNTSASPITSADIPGLYR